MPREPIHHLTSPGDLTASAVACGDRTAQMASWDVTKVTCGPCLRQCTCSPAVPVCPACRTWNAAHRGRPTTLPALTTEKAFQGALQALALDHHWLYYHTYDARKSPAGFPDTVLVRGTTLLLAELKMPGKTPTPAQRQWLDALAEVTHLSTHLWYPADLDTITEVLR